MNTPAQSAAGLQHGTLHWTKVASLGVAIAISGNFSGWNYGLGVGGLGGYTRAVLGLSAGYMCGMAAGSALAVGAGLALTFIDAYASASVAVGGWQLKTAIMVAVIGLQLRGARDAVALTMVTGVVAV